MAYALILYYSRHGSVAALAQEIANGVASVAGLEARIRTVPPVSPEPASIGDNIPAAGPLYCTEEEFAQASGIALGSPGRFGNMAAPLKHFLEQTTQSWISARLVGKPATVFTSTTTSHGGQESTLLSMMLPLLHHGMLISAVPFTEPALHQRGIGGTPYGISHQAGTDHEPLPAEICKLARSHGKRFASYCLRLSNDQKS